MNILYFTYKVRRKLAYYIQLFWFYLKKPFYLLCYNSSGNIIKCDGILLNCTLGVSGRNNLIEIQGGVKLFNTKICISGNNNRLIIKRGTLFNEGGRIRMEDENNLIEIGEKCDIQNCFLTACDRNTKIIIGNNCLFSADIIIRTSDSHSILSSDERRINRGRDTIIGNNVWIGYGVNILKGSMIGDNVVIGTQSVVTGQVPKRSIAVGNPARVVKNDIHWTKERL